MNAVGFENFHIFPLVLFEMMPSSKRRQILADVDRFQHCKIAINASQVNQCVTSLTGHDHGQEIYKYLSNFPKIVRQIFRLMSDCFISVSQGLNNHSLQIYLLYT